MKYILPLLSILILCSGFSGETSGSVLSKQASSRNLLVEAESFQQKGGWVVDAQFTEQMGSSYLMAHGLGKPVADAITEVKFPDKGDYYVFVRTFNWTSPWFPGEGPGKFRLLVNGSPVGPELGAIGSAWFWQPAGKVTISGETALIALRDLTGFNGRVDAVCFSRESVSPPEDQLALAGFRRNMLKLPGQPERAGHFDFVVVGGGVAGTAAALTAARLGLKVALIQDRPILGGNNSSEVRVHLGGRINLEPYPNLGNVVKEMAPAKGGNAQLAPVYEDDKKLALVRAEKNITLFLNHKVFSVKMDGTRIQEVVARYTETSRELAFSAPLFADCTGDGTVGFLAGADYAIGRESREETGEPTAPLTGDRMTMGSSVQWYSVPDQSAAPFPEFSYGLDFNETNAEKVTMGEWTWETGMNQDQIGDFEQIRDYGLMVVFSNWSFLKNHSAGKEKYAGRRLEWVAYVAGKRESRRLLGDHILKEQDMTGFVIYPDASFSTSWSIDLHYPDSLNALHFSGEEFKSIAVHKTIHPYPVPYRCLYSRNVDNLFMAGRNISVTHVALGTVRVMRTTGMMGEVVGMAASVAKKHRTNPRGVYLKYLEELKSLMKKGVEKNNNVSPQDYNLGGTLGPKAVVIPAPPPPMMFGDTARLGRPFAKDPHVILFKGRYLMYYSVPGYTGKDGVVRGWGIGIAESGDLQNWNRVGEVNADPEAPYESKGFAAPCALVKDGKVHLFYQTYGNGKNDAICHAWSSDGLHFTRNKTNPVFHPDGDWNCGRAIDAEVIRFKGKNYLYYATRDPDYKIQMQGVAVAPGKTRFNREDWVNLSKEGPMLKPELPWERDCIEGASVIRKGGKLFMFYAGAYNNAPQQIGLAISTDGIHWTRLSDRPFLPNGKPGEWNASESGHPHIFDNPEGDDFLFFQGNNDNGKTWYISNVKITWENSKPIICL